MSNRSKDIMSILSGWPFEPGKINARCITGRDGRPKIQMRLDMGLLQMDTEGRPDGARPHGCESLLHYYRGRLARHRAIRGGDEGFKLSGAACEKLQAESWMYYQRYLSEFTLDDYKAVIRDTKRNIEVLDLLAKYAANEADRVSMEHQRPYVLMMFTRARAIQSIAETNFVEARRATEEGLAQIRLLGERTGHDQDTEENGEVFELEALLEEIKLRQPVDPIDALETFLVQAVEDERYEEAARLRDRIRDMRDGNNK
ncbi:MAG: UvrB/UvrC motif-containing protein [Planctomycetes bacterium]|nr:UvrB/UvrC motif-containing protein [Planctomycetota bacterium]